MPLFRHIKNGLLQHLIYLLAVLFLEDEYLITIINC